jgi:hypothetical protein
MSYMLAATLCLVAALVLRLIIVPRLEREAAAPIDEAPSIGGWIAVVQLAATVAVTATVAFGGVSIVLFLAVRGNQGPVSTIRSVLGSFHDLREMHQVVASGWLLLALMILATAYFSALHRRSSSLFRQRLAATIAEATAKLDADRAAGEWPALPDNEELAAIRRDIEAVEKRRARAMEAGQPEDADVESQHLRELWGSYYYTDRNRRVDLAACVQRVLSERPASSNWFLEQCTSPLAIRAFPWGTKVLGTVGLPLLFVSLVGLQTGGVLEAADARLSDLRIFASAKQARASFDAALGTIPPDAASEPDPTTPSAEDNEPAINAFARMYELRWLDAAVQDQATMANAHRYADTRAEILREFVAARAKRGVRVELSGAEMVARSEPQFVVGREIRGAMQRIAARSPREAKRILALARESGTLDPPRSSRSEVANALLGTAINGMLASIPTPSEPLGEIVKNAIEEPARKVVNAMLDAEVHRVAAAVLKAQTAEEMRRAVEPPTTRGSSTAMVRSALGEREVNVRKSLNVAEEKVYRGQVGIKRPDRKYDILFPVAKSSGSSGGPTLVEKRAYDPVLLSGFSKTGGVIIGQDSPPPGLPLTVRDIAWTLTLEPPSVTIKMTRGNGSTLALGPYHPAVVAQALAFAADDRRVVVTASGTDVAHFHPTLDETPLGVRALRLDLLIRGYATDIVRPAQAQVQAQIWTYAHVVYGLHTRARFPHVPVDYLDTFADSRQSPFLKQPHIYDANVVNAIAGCRRARYWDDLMTCVAATDIDFSRAKPIVWNTVAVTRGVRDAPYSLTDDLAFAEAPHPLRYVLQLTYRRDPTSTSGKSSETDPQYIDEHPWAFPATSEQVDRAIRDRVGAACNDVIDPMEAFTRLTRLFRAALSGSLGAEFPVEKLARLARETTPFVRTAEVTWPKTDTRPCEHAIPRL